MGSGILLGMSLVFALGDWIAVGSNRRWLEYICKPLTMLGLTIWFMLREPIGVYPVATAFAIGLGFSLIGDVLFMLSHKKSRMAESSDAGADQRSDRLRQGIAAFVVAHIAYSVAFNRGGILITPASLAVGAGVAVLAGGLLRILLPALHATGRSSLRIPVVAYVLVLSFTGWSAMVTLLRGNWILLAAMLVAAGGGAFLLSDAALAINRFVRPLPGGRLFEHVTYHLAQFSMALGMALYLP